MLNPKLKATLTICRHGMPLVVLDSEPFNGLEVRPADLLRLAGQFVELAGMTLRMPTGNKNFCPTKVTLAGDAEQPEQPKTSQE